MKILMVNKFLYPNGGSETYIFKLGDYLKSIGNEVEYFGMEHPDNCVGNNAGAYTDNMDFHNSSALQKIKLSLTTIYSKQAREKIRLVLDDFKPDVVHLNNFNYQLTPSIILEIRKWEKEAGSKVKIVYTAHDYQLICPNHQFYNNDCICESCLGGRFISCTKGRCVHGSMLKSLIGTAEAVYWNKSKVYEQLDSIICCSEFMKNKLDTNPVFKSKTIALRNFIDSVERESVEKGDYVLYFGRYSHEKGIATIIDCKDISFVCAGSGDYEEELNACEHIENVGFKTGNELRELIQGAKCSVYPSTWYENCPFSVMESIMYGTPVVGADIGGIPELIENGRTGVLFESGSTEDFERAIRSIIENDALAKKMSDNCLESKFDTIEKYCEKLIDIYNS